MISKWKLKAVVQKGISFMPWREKVNFLFQKYVTHGVELTDEHFGFKVGHAWDHILYFQKHGEPGPDKKILELGTGWYPVIPLFMYLTKSGHVTSLDIRSWMTRDRQLTTIRKLMEWRAVGKLDTYIHAFDKERWEILEQIDRKPEDYRSEEINQIISFDPLIKDARDTRLPERSYDLICSNNTFEHIPPKILESILLEFKRVVKAGGLMSHFIDMSDHFAHFDKGINIYNFLKYSKKSWRLIDNRIQPQNRMRLKDYIELYNALNIPITEEKIYDGDPLLLSDIKVHSEFAQYTVQDLAVSHAYLVSKMKY
jgi:ubiquinone/menaquinone biosynthesis C-methylase UbiE